MTRPNARITRIRVSNFRSLGRDQVVELGALTVLVGTNGSGKSNIVDVLTFVRDAMHMGLSGAITDRGGSSPFGAGAPADRSTCRSRWISCSSGVPRHTRSRSRATARRSIA